RTLDLEPTWIELARALPELDCLIRPSARAAAVLARLGPYSLRRVGSIEIARVAHCPRPGVVTLFTVGLADHAWPDPQRPRVELAIVAAHAEQLAALAARLIESDCFPEPGVVVRDVFAGEASPHALIAAARSWSLPLPLDE